MTADTGARPPRDFRSLRELMISQAVKLPKRLQQVADFAMHFPDEIAFGTVASIAERANVQPSTLVRFSQAIGYTGFSELQDIFRDRLRDRHTSYNERLAGLRETAHADNPAAKLLEGFAEAAVRSLNSLRERLEFDQVAAAAHRLAAAETIYLIAQRRSFPITAYMNYALGQLGVKTVLIGSPVGTDSETLEFATPRDAAVAISFTPYAATTLTYVRQVAARGVPVVAITDSPFSPLVPASTLWLEVVEADFQGFRSLSATMALVMTLMVIVAEIRRETQ
ncbi:MAG: MurR/RpiR family transcriptional regulator [Ancalomicrobiaceae bacterium]|nr:MurR/RpiR family transcriptional regulator [Ancalomicrobiaceae bacterium]